MQTLLIKLMNRSFYVSVLLIVCSILVEPPGHAQNEINWLDIEQGVKKAIDQDKILLINVYTEWCGFCKRLDQTTFMDKDVMPIIKENFIPVKFNAEMNASIIFDGKKYDYIKEGRRGHHGLAGYLLDNRLGYPTLVYVLKNGKIIHRSPGFRNETDMLKELTYIKEGHYKRVDWRTYKNSN